MTISELYKSVGEDPDNVLERLGDEETVAHFLLMFPDDPSYSLLMQSLRTADRDRAFHAAHTLKGVSLSLGFLRLGAHSDALCRKLREGMVPPGILLQKLREEYDRVIAAINAFKLHR